MPHVKAASSADYGKAARLLETIRSERPDHWPHGLSPDMFDPGDLFLIRKDASSDPVGFVGWQERDMDGQRVGLYSIGLLPQHRHQGIAKEAVSRVLCDRAKSVDRVAALVVPGNLPSEKLAQNLGVPLIKSAGLPPWLVKGLASTAAGLGVGGLVDVAVHKDKGVIGGLAGNKDYDRYAWADLGKNFLSSAAAPYMPGVVGKAALPALAIMSTNMAAANRTAQAANDIAKQQVEATRQATRNPAVGGEHQSGSSGSDWKTMAAAAMVAAALGGGAYALQKAMKAPQEQSGKMRVTLPTKNPGDVETSIELPFNQGEALSNNLKSRLELDTRRRLYAETQERIRRRKGQPAPAFPNLQSKLPELNAA